MVAVPAKLDVDRIRRDFPILDQEVHGKPLVYLDNAATTQKPRPVIEALTRYYERDNANIHRGIHVLSERATAGYEGARERVRDFLNARSTREIIFVRGTTEAINLVATSFGRSRIGPGDEVLITAMEHHSNIVPWQMLCKDVGATLKVLPMDDDGVLELDRLADMLGERTKLVGAIHVSNALGAVNPIEEIVKIAHDHGVPVLVDGAQAVPHMPVDVQALGADFYAFSGHKLYGPTGIGVLYGREELLDAMPPYQGGGEMIRSVTFAETTYNVLPHKFEAGTPNIAGPIGLEAAMDYVEALGWDAIRAHEDDLVAYAAERLGDIDGLRLIGAPPERAGAISFVLQGAHPHDVGTILDGEGVAIRAGHHCAQPLMDRFGIPATVRASFGVYNTRAEIDRLAAGLEKVMEIFG